MGIYTRGTKLWAVYRNTRGGRVYRATPFRVGQEQQATRWLNEVERALRAKAAAPGNLADYAAAWATKRHAAGMSNAMVELGRLRENVLPQLGHKDLAAVTKDDVEALLCDMRGRAAARTLWNIWGALHRLFEDARHDGLVTANPCDVRRGTLPAKVDADPEWRSTAVFTRDELTAICSDPRIALRRRVSYALQFLAGLRYGEVAALQWRHYDAAAHPLGRLLVAGSYDTRNKRLKSTKTKAVRQVPVHPQLAVLLGQWRAQTDASPDAPIFPLPEEPGAVTPNQRAWKDWMADLLALGLRHRRQHDARRTFVSLALADGARGDHLRWVTHGKQSTVMDLYTTLPWATLCEAVACLRVDLRCDAAVTVAPVTTERVLPGAGIENARVLPFRRNTTGVASEPLGAVAHSRAGKDADCHSLLQCLRTAEQCARDGDGAGVVLALEKAVR